jgi:hypothetical protein
MKTIENAVFEAAVKSKLVSPAEIEGNFLKSKELLERLTTISSINVNNLNTKQYDSAIVSDIWTDYLKLVEFKSHLARALQEIIRANEKQAS